MNSQERIQQLLDFRRKARLGGGDKRIEDQYQKGKLTARERITLLLDEGSFEEYDMFVTHRTEDFGLADKKFLSDGVIPQISAIFGPCAGGAVYSPALTDFIIRKLLSFMPQNNLEEPPQTECDDPIDRLEDDLNDIIPESPNQPYDVKDVITRVVDYHDFIEVHEAYAKNIVVGFAKFDGMPAGIVANQPAYLAGVLDIEASRKAA